MPTWAGTKDFFYRSDHARGLVPSPGRAQHDQRPAAPPGGRFAPSRGRALLVPLGADPVEWVASDAKIRPVARP
jgi:hypothetical protein